MAITQCFNLNILKNITSGESSVQFNVLLFNQKEVILAEIMNLFQMCMYGESLIILFYSFFVNRISMFDRKREVTITKDICVQPITKMHRLIINCISFIVSSYLTQG